LTTSAARAFERAKNAGKIVIVCLIAPGDVYPVSEAPNGPRALKNTINIRKTEMRYACFPRGSIKNDLASPSDENPVADIICPSGTQIYPKIVLHLK
jgi:hypothetical protein